MTFEENPSNPPLNVIFFRNILKSAKFFSLQLFKDANLLSQSHPTIVCVCIVQTTPQCAPKNDKSKNGVRVIKHGRGKSLQILVYKKEINQ